MAFDPKAFYRSLDELLDEIEAGSGTPEWFRWLMEQVLVRFGDQLCLGSGRLYVEERVGFRLEKQIRSFDPEVAGLILPLDYPPLRLVAHQGYAVLDRSTEGQRADIEGRLGGLESVAVLIDSDPRRILAFGLEPGWDHERIQLAMHTVRNAVNARLDVVDLRLDIQQLAELQRSLVSRTPAEIPGYSIAAYSEPAGAVGGDLYEIQRITDEATSIAIGDASGHGLAAALVARDVVTGLRMAVESDLKITATIARLNRVISRSTLSSRFVSLLYGELELNGNFFYVNAGHLPGLLFGARGLQRLSIGGSVLGPIEDALFKRGYVHVDRGDTLVLVTDGLIERLSPSGALFGLAGIERAMEDLAGAPADECLKTILAAVEAHADGRPGTDDATMIVITRMRDFRRKITGKQPALSS